MHITNCKSIKTIVVKDREGGNDDEDNDENGGNGEGDTDEDGNEG